MPRERGPGPKYTLPPLVGTQNHDPRKGQAPSYSFGSRYSYRSETGPGPYAIPWGMSNKGWLTHNGFSMLGRHRDPKRPEDNSSTYEPNRSLVEPSSPRYSFGTPRKTNIKSIGPGPVYNLPSTIGPGHAPAARIYGRNQRQSFHYDNSKTPGPSYNPPLANSSQGFTMGKRTYLPGNNFQAPGPIYNPGYEGTVKSSPRFSMGVRHHPDIIALADVSD